MSERKKTECPICHDLISNSNIDRHLKAHEKHGEGYKKYQPIDNLHEVICQYCGKDCRNPGLRVIHEKYECNANANKLTHPSAYPRTNDESSGRYNRGNPAWNRGLTKETDERIRRGIEVFQKNYKEGKYGKWSCKPKSPEVLERLSKLAKERRLGGVRQSKTIEYNGRKLGSKYEYEVAVSLDQYKVKWNTCERLEYIDPFGKKRTYTPDFYLPEYDIYLDPKNDFLINNINPHLGFSDIEKISIVEKAHHIKILVLNKNQLTWPCIKDMITEIKKEANI